MHDACAVAVENRHGQFLGRVARERSKECFELLRRIKSTNFKFTATFSYLATKEVVLSYQQSFGHFTIELGNVRKNWVTLETN